VVVKIDVPAKYNSVVMKYDDLTTFDKQSELLLKKGTSLSVKSIEKQEDYWYITAEVI
jgi:hypothetical protein